MQYGKSRSSPFLLEPDRRAELPRGPRRCHPISPPDAARTSKALLHLGAITREWAKGKKIPESATDSDRCKPCIHSLRQLKVSATRPHGMRVGELPCHPFTLSPCHLSCFALVCVRRSVRRRYVLYGGAATHRLREKAHQLVHVLGHI